MPIAIDEYIVRLNVSASTRNVYYIMICYVTIHFDFAPVDEAHLVYTVHSAGDLSYVESCQRFLEDSQLDQQRHQITALLKCIISKESISLR